MKINKYQLGMVSCVMLWIITLAVLINTILFVFKIAIDYRLGLDVPIVMSIAIGTMMLIMGRGRKKT